MNLVIYKYEIPIKKSFKLNLSLNYKILDIQYQGAQLFAWILINKDALNQDVSFRVFGTGNEIENWGEHVKTVQGNGFVWHIFKN